MNENDRELSQLLVVARAAERRYRSDEDARRTLRQRLLGIDSAAGLSLARRQLVQKAEAAGLRVVEQRQIEGDEGRYMRRHETQIDCIGGTTATAAFFTALEADALRFQVQSVAITPWPAEPNGLKLHLSVDLLERLFLPPPSELPPVFPNLPLAHEESVQTLRSYIVEVGRAVDEGRKSSARLEEARLEAEGVPSVAVGQTLVPLLSLDPGVRPVELTLNPERFRAVARAHDEAAIERWVSITEACPVLMDPALTSVIHHRAPDGSGYTEFTLDAAVTPWVR